MTARSGSEEACVVVVVVGVVAGGVGDVPIVEADGEVDTVVGDSLVFCTQYIVCNVDVETSARREI